MRVAVDHARRDDQAGGVYDLSALEILANLGNLAIFDSDVGNDCTIRKDDLTVLDNEIVHSDQILSLKEPIPIRA